MKKLFFILCLFTICQANAQDYGSNNMGFFIGFGSNQVRQGSGDGGPVFDTGGSFQFGLSYSKYLNSNLAVETALSYLETEIERSPAAGLGLSPTTLPLELVSLRAGLKYSFLRFLFVNGGLLLDFDVENDIIDPQTGLGFGLGIGAEYIFSSGLNIFVNPFLNQHAIIPFRKEDSHQRLLDGGVKLGVGYRF